MATASSVVTYANRRDPAPSPVDNSGDQGSSAGSISGVHPDTI